jgi:hypothetical protein
VVRDHGSEAASRGGGHVWPDYFIFCRQWPKIDPARPMGGWRTAWRNLRKAAGMPKRRFYDLRHQFVTELGENGVPDSVIRELASHVDPATMRIYSHPRIAARRSAVETLTTARPGQAVGYGTNHITKELPAIAKAS